MHFDLGGGWWLIFWILIWAVWSYVEDREKGKKRLEIYERIHKERLYAMDKGIPYPELPPYQIEEPEPLPRASSPWRPLTSWGVVCSITGIGSAAMIALLSDTKARGYWPLGTIPLWLGLGLLASAWTTWRMRLR